ncbi:MAG: putative xylanase/chitin deacetylase, partial [Chthonomonadaceae bacterium]|nr:putative xylanase/chitin deacetylase [Chthonomonadaceae bacterium]
VSYSVDGQAVGLVSTRPFDYTWDTRRVANGRHELTVTFFDRDAREMSHTTRRLRVFNAGGAGDVDRDQEVRVRVALWQELTLRPARCQCTYTLAALHRANGEMRAARDGFARVAALNPNYHDVRAQLAACGGVGEAKGAVFGGLPTEKVIALTFDDGPKPGVTEPLLEMLTNARVPATFFVIGKHVMEYPELTKRIADAGMEIANHSYTHRNLTTLTAEQVAQEMLETQAAVMSVTGKMPRFMRPPGGNWNAAVAQVVREWGLTPCMWTVDVYGSEVLGAQQVANAVLREVQPGSIILMHNGKVSTLQALPTILRELKKRGYTFMTVDALASRRSASQQAGMTPGQLPHRGE